LAAEAGHVEGVGERDHGRAANDALVCAAAVAILCGDRAEAALEAAATAAELTGASARVGEAAGAMALLFQQALSGRRPDPTALRRFAFGPAVSEALNRPRRPALGARRGWASSTLSGVLWVVDRTLERYEPDQWLRRGLTLAVAQGGETETVAALAGGLLGGLEPHGVNLPRWSDDVHGGEWTGQRWTLADLATLTSERYD
jgi:ADP-ribosylglycohydrolase